MDEIIKSSYKYKRLFISNFPTQNSRKMFKFRIYLNAIEIIDFEIINETVVIDFKISDERIIVSEISKILSFIESSLFLQVDKNESIQNKIDENIRKHETFSSVKNKLMFLKNNDVNKSNEFIKFCMYCDNSLKVDLRPYQYKAAFYLSIGNGGFDFSVPGSGKTIISYATYNYLNKNSNLDSVLIIGPINSYNAWLDEYITCFGVSPDFFSLAFLDRKSSINYLYSSNHNHSEITFINVDKVWRLKKEIISFVKNKSVLLIIDEGHKEKNPNAAITQAVLEIAKFVKSRIILTGTPMPNGYEDLFSLMKIYSPYEKILPYSYSQLVNFSKKGASKDEEFKIMNSIYPFYSRVSKKYLIETKELIEPIFNYFHCKISSQQKEIYDFLNKIAFEINDEWEYDFKINLMKAVLIRKMQVSANPGLLSNSIISTIDEYKKEYLEEFEKENSFNELLIKADKELNKIIKKSNIAYLINKFKSGNMSIPKNEKAVEIALKINLEGKRVIIWESFVQNMYTLKSMLCKHSTVNAEIINGNVTGEDRQGVINSFKNGICNVLIASPATLAESISLHRVCQHAIYVNRNFNAAQYIQSKDRIHRINMPNGTTANYYILLNEETVDESVNKRLCLKENRMLRILDSDQILVGGYEFENSSFMSDEDIYETFSK